MSVKISYLNKAIQKTSTNTVLFVDEKFKISNIKKFVTNGEFNYIKDILKTSDLKKNLLVFEINSKKRIVLVSLKKKIKKL